MADPCENADREVLADIAHELAAELALYGPAISHASDLKIRTGLEAGEKTRRDLLQQINAKLVVLGEEPVDAAPPTPRETAEPSHALRAYSAVQKILRSEVGVRSKIRKTIEDDRPCAHTRNFLQTVLSRLDPVPANPV